MTKLKIAASNIGWASTDDDQVFELMGELGFTGVEIAPTRLFPENPYSHDQAFEEYSRELFSKHGLHVCSMQSIWHGMAGNIFRDNDRADLLAYTEAACRFAKAGRVKNLVFGCPKNRAMPQNASSRKVMSFLAECGKKAAAADGVFAIEANPEIYGTNFLNSTSEVIGFLKEMGAPSGLGINLDVGAMVHNGEGIEVVQAALPYISHVHISEPHLAAIEHRKLHQEIRGVLEANGYDGYVSMEMATVPMGIVEESLAYMARTFLT